MLSKVDAFASDPAAFALDNERIEKFITRWQGREGGQERANYVLFLTELCTVLGLPQPDPAGASSEHNDYVFERAVTRMARDGSVSYPRIDLYRRGCFILEAKQSRLAGARNEVAGQLILPEMPSVNRGKKNAERAWDVLMFNARQQAEGYVRLLPGGHEPPPFLIVCDVGHCFEVYANFRRDGKVYDQFPDRQRFRIYLDDLRHEVVRERLRLIWTDPLALDPARQSAVVTRGIAERLAAVSKALEVQDHAAEDVAAFLMRCLFTMFAEDVGLLPVASFKKLLERCETDPSKFVPLVGQLWEAMDRGGFAFAIEANVRRFNGKFFKQRDVLSLDREEIGELRRAATYSWREVDPSIFGTLLEQALDASERRRLGAHYTPRAYVERLVVATVIEPLREDWLAVYSTADLQKAEGRLDEAKRSVAAFHDKLCATRVLDPACGTGNFLYVSLELMKRLEGEVLDALAALGGQEALSGLEGHTVGPQQFFGLEVNPRAAAIAELVLWIGHLQWHVRTRGGLPEDPVLRDYRTVREADAVLGLDGLSPPWPEAEFIVGNPPFLGGKDIRARRGDSYAEALWRAYPAMNDAADYVMYWWHRAADLLARDRTVLRRFGFVTTNSISQVFQRRIVAHHLAAERPVSILLAVPDHPWTRASRDAAAVRIAMTVCAAGRHTGTLLRVLTELGLDTDAPRLVFAPTEGLIINADLTVGIDITGAVPLRANAGLCSPGVKLHGAGFIVSPVEAEHLGLGRRPGLEQHIRAYSNGRDLTARSRGALVIDLFGLGEAEVRHRYPEVYQYLAGSVKPERDRNSRASYRDAWWLFGEPRRLLRPALAGLSRYIATVETAKHRVFQFLPPQTIPDNRLIVIASDDAFVLGILSSRAHELWALRVGGTLEDRPIYTKSRCFDTFPLPTAEFETRDIITKITEEIDAHRKQVLAEHLHLTLTGLYNVRERLRAGARAGDLDPAERRIYDDGLVLILDELHVRLDRAVLDAYGWPQDLTDADLVGRVVALNTARAAEERRGRVTWLRPTFQAVQPVASTSAGEQAEADLVMPSKREAKALFPQRELDQMAVVLLMLVSQPGPKDAATIASRFRQGKKVEKKIAAVLAAVERTGVVLVLDRGRASG
ncbi:MAG: class I SAM-dependent DNA methyltransferase [Janthinobacterium lividum]